ncbi:MAG: hypothetical protein ACLFWI_06360 [Coleofasciculus sp.]|uniref:hypothetical protein n=1 Tax=Coleofasciculus sp. TaxID=3100458 RepID=UPI003A433C1E
MTIKSKVAHKLRDFLRQSLGKRSPDDQEARVESIHKYRRTDHGLESIQQWLSDRMANMETVLALRQVGKTIIWGINSLNSFNQFLVKQEFDSLSKIRKHYLNCAGLVQYRGIS